MGSKPQKIYHEHGKIASLVSFSRLISQDGGGRSQKQAETERVGWELKEFETFHDFSLITANSGANGALESRPAG